MTAENDPLRKPKLGRLPGVDELNNQFILGEMIENLGQLDPLHPHVEIGILVEWLRNVQSHQVDFESTMRKLLRAFQNTKAFKERFDPLDTETKANIKAFVGGKAAEDIIAKTGFEPKPSPSSQRRFKDLDYHQPRTVRSTAQDTHAKKSFWTKLQNAIGCFVEEVEEDEKSAALEVPDDLQARKRLFSQRWGGGDMIVYEDVQKTKVMEVYENVPFENWGLVEEAKNVPALTCVPMKVQGLINLVNWVKRYHPELRIRCAGYRHSWAPIFSEDRQILVSMLNLQQATQLPDPSVISTTSRGNIHNDFKVIGAPAVAADKKSATVRLGAAVTTEEFRRWATNDGDWCLPLDVILGEVTIGGTNGSICHGAGHDQQTLNDLVRAIEYVDCNGQHQKITDKVQLTAAAGCFGLLGIVTHITYELVPMRYAVMLPAKVHTCLAIPHPAGPSPDNVPKALRRPYSSEKWHAALADFERRCDEDYYAEFFWFAYQSTTWLNTWSEPTSDPAGSRDYTSPLETFLQWLQTWLGGVITSTAIYGAIPGRWQAQLLASASMAALPPTTFDTKKDESIKTMVPNALHFRRDDQNMRVRDMEFEIPIPALPGTTDKPDWGVVRRAWWDVIELVYSEVDSPMRLCMELRVMRDSNVLMAPQRGNGKLGTASIEVLTLPDAVTDGEWSGFVQKVCDKWMGTAAEPRNGNVRPHWGKEWSVNGLKMRGLNPKKYLKYHAYKDQIPQFKEILGKVGEQQGWAVDDLRKRFSNQLWDEVIFD